ncbi:MAG: hypothetical protein KGL04_01045 [Elusimicrobia bacterium]|nr:hypothetical protein [Elusimicrobiota bacterium]MDE2312746.1 hypothetical protein [Elusimicrobiota bacterium]
MMRSDAAIRGSSWGMAAVQEVRSTLGSLLERRQPMRLEALVREPDGGYVWKRVFLKKGTRRERD